MNAKTAPVLDIDAAVAWVRARQASGERVVFTNGVFDLLHPGHVRYLERARHEGDVLIVAINSDRSTTAIKGPSRPIIPASERAELLAGLVMVDAVTVFDEDTPADIVRRLQPDVLVKGADWAEDAIVGRDSVEARGGRVVRMSMVPGFSTSNLVERARRAVSPPPQKPVSD
jgi:rfaE bifunctional protein nucleotidyltransferase chain/domain